MRSYDATKMAQLLRSRADHGAKIRAWNLLHIGRYALVFMREDRRPDVRR